MSDRAVFPGLLVLVLVCGLLPARLASGDAAPPPELAAPPRPVCKAAAHQTPDLECLECKGVFQHVKRCQELLEEYGFTARCRTPRPVWTQVWCRPKTPTPPSVPQPILDVLLVPDAPKPTLGTGAPALPPTPDAGAPSPPPDAGAQAASGAAPATAMPNLGGPATPGPAGTVAGSTAPAASAGKSGGCAMISTLPADRVGALGLLLLLLIGWRVTRKVRDRDPS